MSDALRLIGGLRYSHDELDVFHSRNTTLAGPGIQPSFPVTPTGTGQPATIFTSGTQNDNISGKATVQFDRDALGYYNERLGQWIAEKGTFVVEAAASSRDIRLKTEVELKDTFTWLGL